VRVALVRPPGPRLAHGLVTHIERSPVDAGRARDQWGAYVTALVAAGWEPVELDPADECPDAVFVEDTLVLAGEMAVVTRPAAVSRRPETDAAEAAVRALGYSVARIEEPGLLDGGDVLAGDGVVHVGVGDRSNSEGARQLASLVGLRAVEVPLGAALHLKTAVTRLPDGSYAGYPPLLRDPLLFPGLRAVPEPSGANVVSLGGDAVLLSADCPRSAELFAGIGLEPVAVDISELQKLEAGATCLSVLAQRFT